MEKETEAVGEAAGSVAHEAVGEATSDSCSEALGFYVEDSGDKESEQDEPGKWAVASRLLRKTGQPIPWPSSWVERTGTPQSMLANTFDFQGLFKVFGQFKVDILR